MTPSFALRLAFLVSLSSGCAVRSETSEAQGSASAASTSSVAGTYDAVESNQGFDVLTLTADGDDFAFEGAVFTGIWCGPYYRADIKGRARVSGDSIVLTGEVVGPEALLEEPVAVENAAAFLGAHSFERSASGIVVSGYELSRR